VAYREGGTHPGLNPVYLVYPTGETQKGPRHISRKPFTGGIPKGVNPGQKVDGVLAGVMERLGLVKRGRKKEFLSLAGDGLGFPWPRTGKVSHGGVSQGVVPNREGRGRPFQRVPLKKGFSNIGL